MKYFAALLPIVLFASGCSLFRAQDDTSNLKVGSKYTVEIFPEKGKVGIQVDATAPQQVDFTELKVMASIKIGDKRWLVIPQKLAGRFAFATPADLPSNKRSTLRLEVESPQQGREFFEFSVLPVAN